MAGALPPKRTAGPTPRTPLPDWTFTVQGPVRNAASWSWDEFLFLPHEPVTADIHCVTTWSKLDTSWLTRRPAATWC